MENSSQFSPLLDKVEDVEPFYFSTWSVAVFGLMGFLVIFANSAILHYIIQVVSSSNFMNYFLVFYDSAANVIGFLIMGVFAILALVNGFDFGNLSCLVNCWVIETLALIGKSIFYLVRLFKLLYNQFTTLRSFNFVFALRCPGLLREIRFQK